MIWNIKIFILLIKDKWMNFSRVDFWLNKLKEFIIYEGWVI